MIREIIFKSSSSSGEICFHEYGKTVIITVKVGETYRILAERIIVLDQHGKQDLCQLCDKCLNLDKATVTLNSKLHDEVMTLVNEKKMFFNKRAILDVSMNDSYIQLIIYRGMKPERTVFRNSTGLPDTCVRNPSFNSHRQTIMQMKNIATSNDKCAKVI